MAKKTLTPEQAEIKAMKKAKSSQNWTKFWAIVLALVLTVGVVFLGKTQADMAIEAAGTAQGGDETPGTQTPGTETPGTQTPGTETPGTETPGTETPGTETPGTETPGTETPGTQTPGTQTPGTQTPGTQAPQNNNEKADVAKLLNDVTAKAAKGSYTLKRTGGFTKRIDVGSATDRLNGIITGIDPNASLDSVVGGFIGINNPLDTTITNGKGEGFDGKYMLKAMTLTADDIQSVTKSGNTYKVVIKNVANPDANSAWAHASGDYITFDEVNKSISDAVGPTVKVNADKSQANYKELTLNAEIVDGKLTNLTYSYKFDAVLDITIAFVVPATGTGEAKVEGSFTNIKY